MSTRDAARSRAAGELLEELRRRKVRLWCEDDGIGYDATSSLLTGLDAARIQELKPEVLELLALEALEAPAHMPDPQAEAYPGDLFHAQAKRLGMGGDTSSSLPGNSAPDLGPKRFEPGTTWTELPEPLVSEILRRGLSGHILTDDELPVLRKALRQARRRLGARASVQVVHVQAVHFALVELGRDPIQYITDILLASRMEELAPSEPPPAHRQGRRRSIWVKALLRRSRRGGRLPISIPT